MFEAPVSPAAMRPAAALLAALALAGCDLTAPDPIRSAVLTSVTVEALPLGHVWDRDVFGTNGPEVRVDLFSVDSATTAAPSVYVQTETRQDVTAAELPLTLAARTPLFASRVAPVPVQTRVVVTVSDDDTFNEDDRMFTSDTLRFADLLRDDDAVGGERSLTLRDAQTRIRLHVRWE